MDRLSSQSRRPPRTFPAAQQTRWADFLKHLPWLTVVGVAVATYLTALPNGFVSDARSLIPENPSLLTSGEWLAWFGRPYYWGANVLGGFLYRPLTVVSYLMTLKVSGASPVAFLVGNIVLHAAASFLVLELGRHLLDVPAAWLGALLFAAHPLHTEAVAWVGGRPDLLAAVFALASACCFCRATAGGSRHPALAVLLAVTCYLAALLSKEHVITLPAWFGLVWLLEHGKRSLRWTSVAIAGSLGALVLFLWLRAGALPSLRDSVASLTSGLGSPWAPWRWFAGLAIAGKYAALFFWPSRLTFDYTFFPALWARSGAVQPLEVLWGAVVTVGFAVALVWAIRFHRGLALVLAFSALTYAVVSGFPVTPQLVIAERFTYLPSAGACLAAAWVALRIARGARAPSAASVLPSGWREWMVPVVCIGLVALLALRSGIRNADWRTDESVAHAAVRVSMDSPLALRGLGQEAWRAGNLGTARTLLERSLRLDPNRSEPYLLLSQVYEKQGDIAALTGLARRAAVDRAQRKELIQELAGLLWQLGRRSEAEPLFRQVVGDYPDFLPARLALGGILLDRGDAQEALEHFRAATALNPKSPQAWLGMTMATLTLGRRAEARVYADRGKAVGLILPPHVSRALEGGAL